MVLCVFLRGLGIPSRVDPHLLLPMIFFGCGNYGVPYVRSISGGGLYSPILGGKSFVICLPNSSLKVAEFVALVCGLRMSYFEGSESVPMVGDNWRSTSASELTGSFAVCGTHRSGLGSSFLG